MPNTRTAKFAKKVNDDPVPGMLVRYYVGTRICELVRFNSATGCWVVRGYKHVRNGQLVESQPVEREVRVVHGVGRLSGCTFWQPCALV